MTNERPIAEAVSGAHVKFPTTIPTVVYGPMACGKTRNVDRLRMMTGCDSVLDGWVGREPLPHGNVLVLTYLDPREIQWKARGRSYAVRPFSSFGLGGEVVS